MNTIFDRIRYRLAVTKFSQRKASLRGGLSEDAINTLLNQEHSPTLETVRKIAIGLRTTPEWLAYGVGLEDVEIGSTNLIDVSRPAPSSKILPSQQGRSVQRDTSYIQVAAALLHHYVSGALQNESIPEAQADAYADAVLESIRARATAHVVLRLEETFRNAAGSQAPESDGRS